MLYTRMSFDKNVNNHAKIVRVIDNQRKGIDRFAGMRERERKKEREKIKITEEKERAKEERESAEICARAHCAATFNGR